MKKLSIFILPLFLAFFFSVSTQALPQEEKADLVYLQVSSVLVSSFADTPGQASFSDPRLMVDGDLNTSWTAKSDVADQWICFDLGKLKTVSEIKIFWAKIYALDYEILVANNAGDWHQLILMQNNDGDSDILSFEPQGIRYIKILALKCSHPKCGFSIPEVEFYGPAKFNPGETPRGEIFNLR